MAILARFIEGKPLPKGRPLRPAGVDAVVFSPIPALSGYTLTRTCPCVRRICERHGLQLIVLHKPDLAVAAACLGQLPPPGDPARAEAIAARP